MFTSMILFIMIVSIPTDPFAGQSSKPERGTANPIARNVSKTSGERTSGVMNVQAIAAYPYWDNYGDLETKKTAIDFTITKLSDVQKISAVFWGQVKNGAPDGAYMGSVPDAYIYFQHVGGSVSKGKVVGDWRFIMKDDNWESLYPLSEYGAKLLKQAVELHRDRKGLP